MPSSLLLVVVVAPRGGDGDGGAVDAVKNPPRSSSSRNLSKPNGQATSTCGGVVTTAVAGSAGTVTQTKIVEKKCALKFKLWEWSYYSFMP